MGAVVKTLRKVKEKENQSKKVNKRRLKLNYDGDIEEIVEKIIEYNNPQYGLDFQLFSAKEIESILQSNFSILKFDVSEVEVETSKRISWKFAPKRYNVEPTDEDTKTFLDDLLGRNDIESVDENVKSWSKTKVKVQLKDGSEYYKENTTYSVGNTPKAIKINISKDGESLLARPIFTLPGIKIGGSSKKALYKNVAIGGKYRSLPSYTSSDYAQDNLYKILDLNYLIATCRVLENSIKYIDQDCSFLYNPSNSYYNLEYSTEDMEKLLDIKYLSVHGSSLSKKTMNLICECVIAATHIQTSEILNENYRKDLASDYAKSFETKKRIPQKLKDLMKNNEFLNDFKFVELDELTDVNKFYQIENEFNNVREALDVQRFLNKSAELRFRRLGQHKASGLYYPHAKCICIDINTPNSFIHELGHHIDHIANEHGDLSAQPEFRLLAVHYKQELEKTANESVETDSDNVNFYKRKRGYFHTPTEIFARCLEIYLSVSKKMISSFLPSEESLSIEKGYPTLNESLLGKINAYFENIFDIEEGINTTVEGIEQIPLVNAEVAATSCESNEVSAEFHVELETSTETNEEPLWTTGISDNGNESNFFFRIIESTVRETNVPQFKPRRRGRLNRKATAEDSNAVQVSFF